MIKTLATHTRAMKKATLDASVRFSRFLCSALAVTVLLAALAGCRSTSRDAPSRYDLATSVGGCHVKASLDRPASLESKEDQALIKFGRHRLRIEKGWVVLDDNEAAAFPVTANRIDIVISRGTLRMIADGQEMWLRTMPAE